MSTYIEPRSTCHRQTSVPHEPRSIAGSEMIMALTPRALSSPRESPWPPIRGLIPLTMHPPRDANTAQTYSPLQQACQWELNFTHTNLAVNHRVRHSDERKWWANAIQDLVK